MARCHPRRRKYIYPDAFDLRDYDKELVFLQQMRATGVKSATLAMEIDKKISDLILDDEALAKAHAEIEEKASVLGDFSDEDSRYTATTLTRVLLLLTRSERRLASMTLRW